MTNPFEVIEARLSSIESLILDIKHQPKQVKTSQQPKQWLDLNELIKYDPEKRTKPTWYSKISKGEVPYHKRGKKVYFLKSEIDDWLKQGKRKTIQEIEAEADEYLSNKKSTAL
jgi:excisionase family DNA binding protein